MLCVFSAAKILPGWIAACGTNILLATALGVASFAINCLFRDPPILSAEQRSSSEYVTKEQDDENQRVREAHVGIVF